MAMADSSRIVKVYDLHNYEFSIKTPSKGKDPNQAGGAAACLKAVTRWQVTRFNRMETKYMQEGLRRSCEGVILVHLHSHPHVLLLSDHNDDNFRLCGAPEWRLGC